MEGEVKEEQMDQADIVEQQVTTKDLTVSSVKFAKFPYLVRLKQRRKRLVCNSKMSYGKIARRKNVLGYPELKALTPSQRLDEVVDRIMKYCHETGKFAEVMDAFDEMTRQLREACIRD